MAVQYDQLHMVANNATTFQQNLFSGFRGVVSTKLQNVEKKILSQSSPITPVKFVESKWRCSMIIYIWWQTILQNFSKIRSAVSEELRPQNYKMLKKILSQSSPITPVKFVKSKWRCSMIIYIWWQTFLQNFRIIRSAV